MTGTAQWHPPSFLMAVFLLIGCILFPLPIQANMDTPAEKRQQQRERFSSIYKAASWKNADPADWQDLKDYPLYPWLEYEVLQANPFTHSEKAQLDFAKRYPGLRLSSRVYEKLAAKWQRNQQWQKILTHLPPHTHTTVLRCYRLEAALASGQNEIVQSAWDHWQDAEKPLSTRCSGMEQSLIESAHISKHKNGKK
jgi:hypothetical protein